MKQDLIDLLKTKTGITPIGVDTPQPDELYIRIRPEELPAAALFMHKTLSSPVMALFAEDDVKERAKFRLYCGFRDTALIRWIFIVTELPASKPEFPSLSKEIFSSSLFEREMFEQFGITPLGSPDMRRLRLHDEIWPKNVYPMMKSFNGEIFPEGERSSYEFRKVEGDGVFEVPVGPVHAGIIGPGHFRFNAAGEPIINLETRLGFTHRGAEKLFEGKTPEDCLKLSECVSGDSAFAHSWAFCNAIEKTRGIAPDNKTFLKRIVCLELERMYNHIAAEGGIAVDVGFSFPSALASLIKESIHVLNNDLTGSRFLKNINIPGGISESFMEDVMKTLPNRLDGISKDFHELKKLLTSTVSFLDRVNTTGILDRETATDIGMVGLGARASGINTDLRKDMEAYRQLSFAPVTESSGDVHARLMLRLREFEGSIELIRKAIALLSSGTSEKAASTPKSDSALGVVEGARGPVLYWLKIDSEGKIERLKIVDPSFHNWPGLAYCAPGNIIPDFPVCNKSFDLSYSGNDL